MEWKEKQSHLPTKTPTQKCDVKHYIYIYSH